MTTECSSHPSAAAYRAEQLERLRRLPAAPLVALVEGRGGYAACTGEGQGRTSLARRWQDAQAYGTVTWRTADELAVKVLGLHPMLVWGDAWLGVIGDRRHAEADVRALTDHRVDEIVERCLAEGLIDESEAQQIR